MKINSTIGLTLMLLVSMLAAGVLSAIAGMSMGREALKGITQPDTRPTNKLANRKGDTPQRNEVMLLKEDKILTEVKQRVTGKAPAGAAPKAAAKAEPATPQATLPVQVESKGVTLIVRSVEQQGDSFVLSLSMRNESPDPVQFLYSFLELKDDQGRVLNARTEGLPSEMPPDGEEYRGAVRVPVASMEQAKKLSLALADYPNQAVQLKLSAIPIVR